VHKIDTKYLDFGLLGKNDTNQITLRASSEREYLGWVDLLVKVANGEKLDLDPQPQYDKNNQNMLLE
jgi:hypothetical protein